MIHGEHITPIVKLNWNTAAAAIAANNASKMVIIKNCASFTGCISERDNAQVDNDKDTDAMIPVYNLIEYSVKYLKTLGNLRQCYRDILVLNNDDGILVFLMIIIILRLNLNKK